MVLFNYGAKEITAKIVYYGPGLCGKTTNLQYIYKKVPTKTKGKMISLATKSDRTLFFDFLPLDLGHIGGLRTRFQLYTVPGQVFYNSTRKLVLKGADSVVFVADSQKRMMPANIESFDNLKDNLKDEGLNIDNIPLVMQYNKRDLNDISTIEDLNKMLNVSQRPYIPACATSGDGVLETLKMISKLTLEVLSKKYRSKKSPSEKIPSQPGKKSPYVKIEKPVSETITMNKPLVSKPEDKRTEDDASVSDAMVKENSERLEKPIIAPQEEALKEEELKIEEQEDTAEEEQTKAITDDDKRQTPGNTQKENIIKINQSDIADKLIKKEISAPISIPKGTRIKDITFDITLNIKVVTEDE